MKKYYVLVHLGSENTLTTKINSDSPKDIIAWYEGFSYEYLDGSSSPKATRIIIKDLETEKIYTHDYEKRGVC